MAEVTDLHAMSHALHAAAIASGVAPLDALRTRLVVHDHYLVADLRPENKFVAVSGRFLEGRSLADKQRLSGALMDAMVEHLGDAERDITLSVEYQEIDAATRLNRNTLKVRLESQHMSAGGSFEQNTADAARHLRPFASDTLGHLINGAKVSSVSGATFTNTSPIDHSELGQVAAGDHDDIDAAARAADAAFAEWRATPGATRRRVLHDLADLIEERAQQIALVESVDTGQAIRFMSSAALRGAENFRYFADMAPSVGDGQSLPTEEFVNYTLRRAIGPVGVITPWNTPFMLSTWKIAPALAAGCTVVHKPAEWSPLSASLLADFAIEAGLPAGVLNVVHGMGHTAGRSLTEHPLIRAVAFVGESVTGSAIQAQSAATLKRLHFELGGKNPVIVFDDADLDRALDAVVFMIFSLNGERCTSSSRLLVQQSVRDEFERRLTERVHALRVGHPLDPSTEIGPAHPHGPPRQGPQLRADRQRWRRHRGRRWRRTDRPVVELRQPDAVPERRQRHAHRSRRDLRAGAHQHRVHRRGRRPAVSPTTPTTGWPHTCGPATPVVPTGWAAIWMSAWCGSTRTTFAICPRRSAAPSAAASAATVAITRSSSTPRPRTSRSPTATTRSPSSVRFGDDR